MVGANRMITSTQLDLFSSNPVAINPTLHTKKPKPNCDHVGFDAAQVPSGLYCTNCDMVVTRYLPPVKNEPEILGYITATWAWKYEDGREWTRDIKDEQEKVA